METLLRIFLGRSSTVHEEAMLAVGAFSYALGRQFNKYMAGFMPYLLTGLLNYREWQVGGTAGALPACLLSACWRGCRNCVCAVPVYSGTAVGAGVYIRTL